LVYSSSEPPITFAYPLHGHPAVTSRLGHSGRIKVIKHPRNELILSVIQFLVPEGPMNPMPLEGSSNLVSGLIELAHVSQAHHETDDKTHADRTESPPEPGHAPPADGAKCS